MSRPKITFGIIVLNGQPFTRYCLRSLYPFAHEIIIVEGASPGAQSVASPDGHSRDDTLGVIVDFIANEDPEKKVVLVTAEDEGHPNGFWPGEKDQQSQAYASRATGDYLWQVDIDEFYLPDQMNQVIDLLEQDPSITGMSFKTHTFWGSPEVTVDGPFLIQGAEIYHRLFKWGKGYRYTTHRPPTVVNEHGVDTKEIHYLQGKKLYKKYGICMMHYSLLLPKQVREKAEYYQRVKQFEYEPLTWYEKAYEKLGWPFRYHNVYLYRSWLSRYKGQVPEQIQAMVKDIGSGKTSGQLRDNDDLEVLLASKSYRFKRMLWRIFWPLDKPYNRIKNAVANRWHRVCKWLHLPHRAH